jgi:hypothetical protein
MVSFRTRYFFSTWLLPPFQAPERRLPALQPGVPHAAAWRVASRDAFIGWSADERKNQLYRVVNNYRFLILP